MKGNAFTPLHFTLGLDQVSAQIQIVFNGHFRPHMPFFRAVSQTQLQNMFRATTTDHLSLPGDLARSRADQTGDCPERGGFPGAIGSQNGYNFTRLHMQADAMQGRQIAITRHHILQRQ